MEGKKKRKRYSKVIHIQLGSDVHRMVRNEHNECYCLKCSLRSICYEMGSSRSKSLCDALLDEVYYDSREEFSPYGGHFVLNAK